MSILASPYESSDKKTNEGRREELLVFGYSCKMYRNDAKSIMENSGQLLIPWMGDRSLMVDRYDARNKLDDKSQFGLKPNLPRPMSAEEMDLEDELDEERYLALEWDEIRVEEQEEMEKRKRASGYCAVGFSYDSKLPEEDLDGKPIEESSSSSSLPSQVTPYDYVTFKRMEHPSTATVDHGSEEDQFTLQQDFIVPDGIQLPSTNKLHSIIEKTANFICKQGNQMEIIIKTKQKFNPYFSFLNHEDDLYPYYKHLKAVIASGSYVPKVIPIKNGEDKSEGQAVSPVGKEVDTYMTKEEAEEVSKEENISEEQKTLANTAEKVAESDGVLNTKQRRSKSGSLTESDSEGSDSEDEGYLHPLLLGGGGATKTKVPSPAPPPKSDESASKSSNELVAKASESEAKKMSLEEIMSMHDTSASFMARSLNINSAPLMARATAGETTRAYATDSHMDPEAVAAYEYYKKQYCNSNSASSAAVAVERQEGWYGYNQPTEDYAAIYDGDHQQQLVPMNGHNERNQQQHYNNNNHDHQYHVSSEGHSHHPHSNYAPPPPPSVHQYPPPYYQCPPEAVPPPEIRAIVDKTAEYVAKNSEKFERTVLERHLSDSRFSFLNPWDPYNYYYEAMKQYNRSMQEMSEDQEIPPHPPSSQSTAVSELHAAQKNNVQKLSSSGAVSFKLQRSKGLSSAGFVTPASGFNPESYYDEYEDEEELVNVEDPGGVEEAAIEQEISSPPVKKQKVIAEDDEIGNTVQAFLSTVKGLFNQVTS